ncbi:MAG: xanthine dehydrogenase family protein subunit M [Vicinamibacterales bacterium]
MFATDFDYYRAGSVSEAGQLLQAHPGAKLLAGGHSLIPLLKLRLAAPATVIDIGRIGELKGITVSGDTLKIGSLTTHAELAASAAVRQHAAALAEAAGQIGDPAVRNRGTVGGNVAHADPASDLPTVLAALGATFGVVGAGGVRTIDASEFFQGIMTTALGENDLLTFIEVPVAHTGDGSAYAKFSHPASRYAVIGVAASVSISAGSCTGAAIAVGGLVPTPCRAASVEQALTGQVLTPDVIATASQAVSNDVGDDPLGDIFASGEYRKAVAHVYVGRAVAAAAERAAGA